MHTVLRDPSERLRQVTCELVELSDKVVVMAQRGIEMLVDIYDAPREKLVMIPHGIPDVPFVDASSFGSLLFERHHVCFGHLSGFLLNACRFR